jgi:hypothetical protein
MRVIEAARRAEVPVEVISGRRAEGAFSLEELAGSAELAMADPARWLREATRISVTKVAAP